MTPVALDRLRDGRDISAVLRGRRQRAGRLVVVHGRERSEIGTAPRIAVVASRRIGNAVARNRAKRLLREASRHLPWIEDVDIVLVARAACAGSTFTAVHTELGRIAHELGLLVEEPATDDQVPAAGSGVARRVRS